MRSRGSWRKGKQSCSAPAPVGRRGRSALTGADGGLSERFNAAADGVHLNAAGHEAQAAAVREALTRFPQACRPA